MQSTRPACVFTPSVKTKLLLAAVTMLVASACGPDETNTTDSNQSTNNSTTTNNTAANNTAANNTAANNTAANNTAVNNTAANNTAANNTANSTTPPECTEDAACDDGDPCTVNTCSEAGECVTAQAADGAVCDDVMA